MVFVYFGSGLFNSVVCFLGICWKRYFWVFSWLWWMCSLSLVACLFICYAGIWVCFVLVVVWVGDMMLMLTGCMIVFACYGYVVIDYVILLCCIVFVTCVS